MLNIIQKTYNKFLIVQIYFSCYTFQVINSQSETAIVEQASTDIQYFKYLYDKYYSPIFAYVMFLTGDKTITEDIVSSTFEKAMMSITKYENRGYSFGAWLFRIARNLTYDQTSKFKTLQLSTLEEIIGISDNYDTEKIAQESIEKEKLFEAINKLIPMEKEVIMLKYIQEFSIEEVSNVMGKSIDAIKSLNKRALDHLKILLENKIGDTF